MRHKTKSTQSEPERGTKDESPRRQVGAERGAGLGHGHKLGYTDKHSSTMRHAPGAILPPAQLAAYSSSASITPKCSSSLWMLQMQAARRGAVAVFLAAPADGKAGPLLLPLAAS